MCPVDLCNHLCNLLAGSALDAQKEMAMGRVDLCKLLLR